MSATPDVVCGVPTIVYSTTNTLIRQDPDDPGCVAACAATILVDKGKAVTYAQAKQGIPPTTVHGVQGRKLSNAAIYINRVDSSLQARVPPLINIVGIDNYVSQGMSVVVGFKGTTGTGETGYNIQHVVVVDGIRIVQGVKYYLIRDPSDQSILDPATFGLPESRFSQLWQGGGCRAILIG